MGVGAGVGWHASERAHRKQRWSARASLAAVTLAALLPLVYGGVGGVLLLLAGVAGMAVTAAGLWWALTRRGVARVAAAALAVAAPVAVVGMFAAANLLWVVTLSLALWAVAVWTGRYALRSTGLRPVRVKEHRTPPPRRPFLVMNPRSGGAKVERFGLKEKAERLGARVVLLDPERPEDVTELARRAVADGADLLGVAGGDGTQALVAAVAAEHGLPFLVVSAGTRNHFAMDLGLDRDDPAACLDALTDGVELHVDLGFAGGRPFVNNVSFGVYGTVVQSPAYRNDKVGTALDLLPDLLTRQSGPRLTAHAEGTTLTDPQALLVSNNPYRRDDPAGLGRRERLDSGVLGVLGIRVDSAAEAAGLLLDPEAGGLTVLTARDVVVEADRPSIEVGIDGEAFVLPAPVHCRIAPRALRVRVPRFRPGVPQPQPPLDWRRLRKLAAAVGRTAVTGRPRSRHAVSEPPFMGPTA
ncbi:diacylglycerol kinase [Streptomyces sp. CB03234]|uniref:diacylglycerol/lipid kinase family protein n=1 Tax=Streptomyces sp. (strain CB03234) TaxID=1703937 RepID=UPI000939505C|nr:diacylglycerol kinase family protein [Streptomyces sp. CB03234]OKK03802.1 diacylglycerol kinase [Streptomyces sp. CB03234]